MGKGSSARPFSVSKDEYDNRFETIFGKKNRYANGTTTTRQDTSAGEADTGSSQPTQTNSSESCGTAKNDTATTTTN